MNEKANEVLIQLINRAMQGIDAAVQFSQAQIPEVIHQLLLWNGISSILFQVFAVSLVALGLYGRRYTLRAKANGESWTAHDGKPNDSCFISSTSYDFLCVILPVTSFVAGCTMFFLNFDWLKILIAPKLYLLEYAAILVK